MLRKKSNTSYNLDYGAYLGLGSRLDTEAKASFGYSTRVTIVISSRISKKDEVFESNIESVACPISKMIRCKKTTINFNRYNLNCVTSVNNSYIDCL